MPIQVAKSYDTILRVTWDFLGNEWAARLLQAHVAQGQVRHAYLLAGPPGVGRRTLGLRLGQAVNCLNPPEPGQPCGKCAACKRMAAMQHPDLTVVQAEQLGGTLKVDQIRELQHTLSLAPYEARYRIALLLRFEEANPSAANALLKTLEEPSPQVILILTAENAESLLPTIASRCEVLRLNPMPVADLERAIQERWQLPEDQMPQQAGLLAHLSGGRPGYAYTLHQTPDLLDLRSKWLDDLARMLRSTRVERFDFAEALSKDKDAARLVLQTWLSWWRDVLLSASTAAVPLTNLDRVQEIQELAGRVGMAKAHQVVTSLEKTLDLFDHNTNTRLAVEVLMLDMPHI